MTVNMLRSGGALLVLALNASVSVPPSPSAYRVSYYALDLRIDPEAKLLGGSVRVTGRVGREGLAHLGLDLAQSMTVDSAVQAASRGGRTLDVEHMMNVLRLTPKRPWRANETFDIKIFYHGSPAQPAFTFVGTGDSARMASYGMPDAAREWWPSHDSPGEKADSADITITAPSALTVVSNGRLVGRHPAGSDSFATTQWAVRYPIYPDVVSLAIARYASFTFAYQTLAGRAMEMPFFVFPADEAKARVDFSVLPDVMRFYVSLLGEYPFVREKYGVAEFPVMSFREHQTIPSYGPQLITGDHRNDATLAHELAHQWFGNSLTVDNWSDIWLNESFATYMSLLWTEHAKGEAAYGAAIAARMKLSYPGTLVLADSQDHDHMFTPTTFQKGAVVLHMLRRTIGDSAFFVALREYVSDHRYGHVSPAAFQSEAERASGRPLGWFFDEWLHRADQPAYRLEWQQHRDASGYVVDAVVTQGGTTTPFRMPVEIDVQSDSGTATHVVVDSSAVARFSFHSQDSVSAVLFDPRRNVLRTPVPGS